MMESVETVLRIVENDARQNLDGQLDLFSAMAGAEEAPQNDDYQVPNLREYDSGELLKMEKEVSGLYLSGHPLDAYREKIEKSPPVPSLSCRERMPGILITRRLPWYVPWSKTRS